MGEVESFVFDVLIFEVLFVLVLDVGLVDGEMVEGEGLVEIEELVETALPHRVLFPLEPFLEVLWLFLFLFGLIFFHINNFM